MCGKTQFKYCPSKIDDCMVNLISFMKVKGRGLWPLSCCCGHGKYPITIVITNGEIIWELMSNEIIPRKKKFYKKDKEGYYFIPEVLKNKK